MGKKLSRSIKVGVALFVAAFFVIVIVAWVSFSRYMGFPPLNVKLSEIQEIQKMDDGYVREILVANFDGYEKFLGWVYPQKVDFWSRTDDANKIALVMASIKSVRITEPDTFLGTDLLLCFKGKDGNIYTIDLYNYEGKTTFGVGYEDKTGRLYEALADAGLVAASNVEASD